MAPVFDPYHLTLIVVALITGVISPIALQITKYLLTKKLSPKKYKDTAKSDIIISAKLDSIMQKYEADRAWISEFHNGDKTYSGKSLQKFSETYEEAKKGISLEYFNTQSIPTSLFTRFFSELNTKGFYYLNNIDNLNLKDATDLVGISLESFLQARNIKSFFAAAIKDIKGNFVGVLCMDKTTSPLKLDEKTIQDLIYTAANLAGYLEEATQS